MKPLTITILILLFSVSIGFANQPLAKALSSSSKKQVIPPGTVLFEEGLYVDMTEITNFSWLEYMYWNKNKYGTASEAYKAALPDTTVWQNTNPLFEQMYLRHPAFHNYPVVGVSYEQALKFCAWRSDRVNELLFAKKNKFEYHFYKTDSTFCEIPQICSYRLPTEKEWEKFAAAPFSKKVIRKQKDNAIYNVKGTAITDKKGNETNDVTASVHSFWPNNYGMYQVVGNVAEMVSEKGIAKGGSWFHTIQESAISTSIPYSASTGWLGFRCVCEVKK